MGGPKVGSSAHMIAHNLELQSGASGAVFGLYVHCRHMAVCIPADNTLICRK